MRYEVAGWTVGPSGLAEQPVVQLRLAGVPDHPSAVARARAAVEAMVQAAPELCHRRVAAMNLDDGWGARRSIPEIVGLGAVTLQRWAGHPIPAVVHVRERDGVVEVGVPYRWPTVGAAALERVVRAVQRGVNGDRAWNDHDRAELLEPYLAHVVRRTSPVAVVEAAEARGVPWRQVGADGHVVELGQGRWRRRLWYGYTDATPHLASRLAGHKPTASVVLRAHGLPVPDGAIAEHPDAAVRVASLLGWPVVVKPAAKDYGTAVHVGLVDAEGVRAAFADASQHGAVLVERQIPGEHHRLMVLDGRFLSARRQRAAHVVGDGVRSVRALVVSSNQERVARGWVPVPLDGLASRLLRRQGLWEEAVPEAGQRVFLRSQGNLSQGGSMEVVTDAVHPDNARMAVRAAQALGLDFAGIDFITPDIGRSHLEGAGQICEVNPTPGMILGEEALLVDHLIPGPGSGRIPVVGVWEGQNADVARLVAALEARVGPVAWVSERGLGVGDTRLAAGDRRTAAGVQAAVTERSAAGAVVALRADAVDREGLGVDRLDLLVVPEGSAAAVLSRVEAVSTRVVRGAEAELWAQAERAVAEG